MKTLIVGGDISAARSSNVINKLALSMVSQMDFLDLDICNGELPDDIKGYKLVLWFPHIDNHYAKTYPVKDRGSIMIISKVMRDGYTEATAVSRIFDFHANAVICIYKDKEDSYFFSLVDALGNTWCNTNNIAVLADTIKSFTRWSMGQIRMSYVKVHAPMSDISGKVRLEKDFIELNLDVADKVANSAGTRFFGNFSTRCASLFPSHRYMKGRYVVSPRNLDKRQIGPMDAVPVEPPYYHGDRKPSVDTPVQIKLYEMFDHINYMIHGHAFIKGASYTQHYFPCGDLREVEGIAEILYRGKRAVNLKNHGFLLVGKDPEEIRRTLDVIEFQPLDILKGV